MKFDNGKDAASYLRKRATARRALIAGRDLNEAVAQSLEEVADMFDPPETADEETAASSKGQPSLNEEAQ